MIRSVLLLAIVGSLLVLVLEARAGRVVVLTEEPVAVFTLPDGKVLTNAYAWKRTSEGVMIIHDGGQYFLNFKTLPADWRKAYDVDASVGQATAAPSKRKDQYSMFAYLERLKDVHYKAVTFFESRQYNGDSDAELLKACALQALLDGDVDAALRLNGVVRDHFQDHETLDLASFYIPCAACATNGVIIRTCQECDGSGKCIKCGGTGEIPSQFINKDPLRCVYCKASGKCPKCEGTGKRSFTCNVCNGRRKLLERDRVKEQIAICAERLNARHAAEKP